MYERLQQSMFRVKVHSNDSNLNNRIILGTVVRALYNRQMANKTRSIRLADSHALLVQLIVNLLNSPAGEEVRVYQQPELIDH